MREASKNGVKVRLITRRPERVEGQYHKLLREDRVYLTYYPRVHAKLIVADRKVAIVSSMNFYSESSAGESWEAGLISMDSDVSESIANSILRLLEKPESRNF